MITQSYTDALSAAAVTDLCEHATAALGRVRLSQRLVFFTWREQTYKAMREKAGFVVARQNGRCYAGKRCGKSEWL
jgi:hypothetical protein